MLGLEHPSTKRCGGEIGSEGGKWWCSYGHSRRGLEHVADPSLGYARHIGVREHVQAVMEEQGRQRDRGVRDERMMGIVSRRKSKEARERGEREGRRDQEIAKIVRAEWATGRKGGEGPGGKEGGYEGEEEDEGEEGRREEGGGVGILVGMGRKDSVQNLRDLRGKREGH